VSEAPLTILLGPEQLAELARLVADELRGTPAEPTGLVDAETLAGLLGVSRDYVYDHAGELGAVSIGNGPRPRKRFDVATARAALERQAASPSPRRAPRRRRQRAVALVPNASGAAPRQRPAPGPGE
jgi:hypothetical protein